MGFQVYPVLFAVSAYSPKHVARRELHMRGPHDDQQESILTTDGRVSSLPRNNHGFADRTACCPRRVGDSHLYVREMRPEQDQGGSVHGRAVGGRVVVVRRRQRPKRRRASWQASSPGKHTRQTCGLSA